ncbi:MAG: hypothetical protein L6Q60_14140 [Rhodocyclaceae bacterium]|nr:hypothetical protein [Rhodocyclaceae bacterium]
MGFLGQVKRGLAYGLGGGLGWSIGNAIGNFVVTWVKRIALIIFLGGGAGTVSMCQQGRGPFDGPKEKPAAEQPAKTIKQQQHQQQ